MTNSVPPTPGVLGLAPTVHADSIRKEHGRTGADSDLVWITRAGQPYRALVDRDTGTPIWISDTPIEWGACLCGAERPVNGSMAVGRCARCRYRAALAPMAEEDR